MNPKLWFICQGCGYRVRKIKETAEFFGEPRKYIVGSETVEVCLDCFEALTRPLNAGMVIE